jgi:tetratricopeptide (TPR) repeat protein
MHSFAQDLVGAKNYDKKLLQLLPPYCQYYIRDVYMPGSAEYNQWNAKMGEGMEHIHHYCRGLNYTNVAMLEARTREKRLELLAYSIGEFDYVLRSTSNRFKLRPELLTKRGENLIRMGKFPEAIPSLYTAIDLRPDYWPPYVAISDYYRDNGEPGKAREWLEKALAAAPDSKTLKLKIAELAKAKSKPASASEEKPEKEPATTQAERPAAK